MVISDVLFEAVKEIREYQNNGTGMYDSDKENIDKLCDVMDEFRQREGYDTPPGMPTGQPGDEDVRIGGVADELAANEAETALADGNLAELRDRLDARDNG